jgi:multiple sugar transport system substrate-binding protein
VLTQRQQPGGKIMLARVRTPRSRNYLMAASLGIMALLAPNAAHAQDSLVTPEVIGRPDAPLTISIQPRFGYSHQSNDPARGKTLTEAFDSWIHRHPDVRLDVLIQQGDDAVIVAKRIEDANAGRAADVIMVEQPDYQKFYSLTESFSPYLAANEVADFLPGIMQGMKDPDTGEIKYLQITAYTYGLWYRKDLVDTPPTSLEELSEVAAKLKEEHDFRYGMFVLGGQAVDRLTLLSHVASLGGQVMADDAQSTPVFGEGENRDVLIRVLAWYKEQVDKGLMPTDVVNFAATGDAVSRVAAGEMPFLLGGTFMGGGIAQTPDGDKWAFAPLPQLGGAEPVMYQSGWAWGMFTKDPAKQALITDMLMDTYIGPWAMATWGEAGGYTPTRASALQNYRSFIADTNDRLFADALATAIPLPNGTHANLVATALTTAFQQVILGTLTPEQAVDEAWTTVQLEM